MLWQCPAVGIPHRRIEDMPPEEKSNFWGVLEDEFVCDPLECPNTCAIKLSFLDTFLRRRHGGSLLA